LKPRRRPRRLPISLFGGHRHEHLRQAGPRPDTSIKVSLEPAPDSAALFSRASDVADRLQPPGNTEHRGVSGIHHSPINREQRGPCSPVWAFTESFLPLDSRAHADSAAERVLLPGGGALDYSSGSRSREHRAGGVAESPVPEAVAGSDPSNLASPRRRIAAERFSSLQRKNDE